MRIVEQELDIQVIIHEGVRNSRDHQIDAALLQLMKFQSSDIGFNDIANDLWIAARKSIDGVSDQSSRKELRAGDTYFSRRRVCERFNFLDSLPQFIEYDVPALEQRGSVDRRLDAPRAAIEQAHAQRAFQIGDRLGDN